jgi:hypothetical protein
MVALLAMDGGDFGCETSVMHRARRRDHALLDKHRAVIPPCSLQPYDYLIIVYAEPGPLAASSVGLLTPYNHRVTPNGSLLRQEYYAHWRIVVYHQNISVVLFCSCT